MQCRWQLMTASGEQLKRLTSILHRDMYENCVLQMLLLVLLVSSALALDFGCRDKDNNPVEWFAFYKIGRLKDPSITNPHILNGTGFIYLDSNNKQWDLPPDLGMESQGQAVGFTLQQYYDNAGDSEVTSIFYNDELPYPDDDTYSYTSGHTKGFLVFGEQNGFWMLHSIPKFPRNDMYEFPRNAHYYGQMGICVSLLYSALPDIANQLYFTRPFISSWSLSQSADQEIPLLAEVIAGEFQKDPPFTSRRLFTGTSGTPFTHFAKAGGFGQDLYYDLVAPSLLVSLKVESWQHETAYDKNLPSQCDPPSPFQVLNAKDLSLPFGIHFDNYMDHSKFAVATSPDGSGYVPPWICIGDINRQTGQLHRGGGTMCLADFDLYNSFQNIISDYWPCQDFFDSPR